MVEARWLVVLTMAVAAACGRPASRPPRDLPRVVAVLPPYNQTGDPLLVSGGSFLEQYAFHTEPVTVPELLAAEARLQLERRGFLVVPSDDVETATKGRAPRSPEAAADMASQGRLEGVALHLDLRRWEPNAPTQPTFVIVGLTGSLVDPATHRVLWTADRATAPVATPGVVVLGQAYMIAARKVIEELLSPLGPVRPPPS